MCGIRAQEHKGENYVIRCQPHYALVTAFDVVIAVCICFPFDNFILVARIRGHCICRVYSEENDVLNIL